MPLLDHFRPPLSERRPWESFHTTWGSALADAINEDLPPGYIALEPIHAGASVEIDVAAFAEEAAARSGEGGGTGTLARAVWTPAAAPIILPATFPPNCTIEILSTDGSRSLVAAVELVSPGNKDRAVKRRQFVAKCATYLSRGIGLIVVDVVTSRQGNLHDELMGWLELGEAARMPTDCTLYAVAYRPLEESGVGRIETWPHPLSIGDVLPTLPLSLAADLCVAVDLEAAYLEACQRRRVEEALG